jgi:hypothetical protein
MKKLFLLIQGVALSFNLFSQDIITKKNGEDIKAQVLEVTDTEVKYKKFEQASGPTYTASKKDIVLIRYQDGSKDLFSTESIVTSDVSKKKNAQYTDSEYERMGREDAIRNYKGKRSGAGGTLATAALTSPVIGLIPAIACSSTPPTYENLNIYDSELMKNEAYSRGYRELAHKIKKRKVWTNFGIGSGIYLVIYLILLSGG